MKMCFTSVRCSCSWRITMFKLPSNSTIWWSNRLTRSRISDRNRATTDCSALIYRSLGPSASRTLRRYQAAYYADIPSKHNHLRCPAQNYWYRSSGMPYKWSLLTLIACRKIWNEHNYYLLWFQNSSSTLTCKQVPISLEALTACPSSTNIVYRQTILIWRCGHFVYQPYLNNTPDAENVNRTKLILSWIRSIIQVECEPYVHWHSEDYVELVFSFAHDCPTRRFAPNMCRPKSNSDGIWRSKQTLQHFGSGTRLRLFLSWILCSTPSPHHPVHSEIPVENWRFVLDCIVIEFSGTGHLQYYYGTRKAVVQENRMTNPWMWRIDFSTNDHCRKHGSTRVWHAISHHWNTRKPK